jgi:nickel/cobalt exporter
MSPIIENPFSWVYFPTALALGALHALEPGHAKTLTAAYLIGIKGTKRDAVLLGLSVAITHSFVVIGISVAALWLGRETFTRDVTHWLQVGSGVIVILLGLWMLQRRIRQLSSAPHAHGAPEPVPIRSPKASGSLAIVSTPDGERMQFRAAKMENGARLRVVIQRPEALEVLPLLRSETEPGLFQSTDAPAEPHEFSAEFEITLGAETTLVRFEMHEPHDHDHGHLSDDEHARAHAADMPEYAKRGERPSLGQIVAFGAAGGMIPCPASITVMLLALSIGRFASGLLAVAGFSLGLALTLVGMGLIVVAGISRLQHGTGRLHWLSVQAPIISPVVVIVSGIAALMFAH